MKRFYFIFFVFAQLLFNTESYSQTIFHSNFDQSHWGQWQNSTDWRINGNDILEGHNCLQHNIYHRNGYSYLSHKIEGIDLLSQLISWEFTLKNGDWFPNSNERYGMFLLGNKEELSTASGYAMGVNLTSSEGKLEICKIKDGIAVEQLYLSPITFDISEGMTFLIERDNTSQWTLQFKKFGENNWENMIYFTSVEDEVFEDNYIGPFFQHNANHGGQFFVDDIYLEATSLSPVIETVRFNSPNSIEVLFSQPMNGIGLQDTENYQVVDDNGAEIAIDTIEVDDDFQSVQLKLLEIPTTSSCTIMVGELVDTDSLRLEEASKTLTLLYAIDPKLHDLLFSEIMFDNKESEVYSGKEYIEIKNQQDYPLFLGHTYLKIGDSYQLLPNIVLPPNTYALLSKSEESSTNNKEVLEIPLSKLTLRNSGNYLELSTNGILNDSISYTPNFAETSGISAEKIDLTRFCGHENNWTQSTASLGGTPGAENSVNRENRDTEVPYVIDSELITPSKVQLLFSETIVFEPENISCTTDQVTCQQIGSNSLQIEWDRLLKFGESIEFELETISDLCSNIDTIHCTIRNQNPEEGDLVLSELLFDPSIGSEEYIECANISEFTIDASNIRFAIKSETSGEEKLYIPTTEKIQLPPNSYIVFTKDSLAITNTFTVENPKYLVETQTVPALPNSGGTLVLLNSNQTKIDSIAYSPENHSSHLSETKGISLERKNLLQNNSLPQWNSANSNSGGGTPTFENSIQETEDEKEGWIVYSNQEVSPNGDSYHDNINFSIQMQKGDWLSTVNVYDISGRVVRALQNNVRFGTNQQVKWNGLGNNNKKLPIGNYIIVVKLTSELGETKQNKQSVAITDRLE